MADDLEVGDEQLRLMLLCCHPALARNSQIALTLRLVGGLTTSEVSGALLVSEATLAQRIVRAKQKIRDAGIPLSMPARFAERVDALLGILYLIFNEGYLARGGIAAGRIDLVEEAIRLTIRLLEQVPDHPEVRGLLALELYIRARARTRFHNDRIVLLEHQDRSLWDRELIEQADGLLRPTLSGNVMGGYALQAAIARCHAHASDWEATDWGRIVALYSAWLELTPTPVIALNHAVAVSMVDGPIAGLALVNSLIGLQGYYLYWAARGELLARSGQPGAALLDLERARALAVNPAEKCHLDERIDVLRATGSSQG